MKIVRATSRDERQSYVTERMGMYWDFLTEVANGPFSSIEKMVFAAISANTLMDHAIDGFMAIQDKVMVDDVANALLFWGVNAPFNKAAFVCGIRETPEYLIPNPDVDMLEQRRTAVPEILGLGYAKYSFASSLITPFESDIVCLDTHMAQTLTGEIPTSASLYGKSKRCIENYLQLEDILRREAAEINAPIFLFQWGVWDLHRKLTQGNPPETHDFLWQRGRSHFQITMDGLEAAA